MARILVIGYKPDEVDYSDPGPPKGLTPERVWNATAESLLRIEDYGWQADQCLVAPNNTAKTQVEAVLTSTRYDCIVIGGGVRMAEKSVEVFEQIVDSIRHLAADTPIAFNTGPDKSLEAAKRWIKDAS